jgi:hypothetical protein
MAPPVYGAGAPGQLAHLRRGHRRHTGFEAAREDILHKCRRPYTAQCGGPTLRGNPAMGSAPPSPPAGALVVASADVRGAAASQSIAAAVQAERIMGLIDAFTLIAFRSVRGGDAHGEPSLPQATEGGRTGVLLLVRSGGAAEVASLSCCNFATARVPGGGQSMRRSPPRGWFGRLAGSGCS